MLCSGPSCTSSTQDHITYDKLETQRRQSLFSCQRLVLVVDPYTCSLENELHENNGGSIVTAIFGNISGTFLGQYIVFVDKMINNLGGGYFPASAVCIMLTCSGMV